MEVIIGLIIVFINFAILGLNVFITYRNITETKYKKVFYVPEEIKTVDEKRKVEDENIVEYETLEKGKLRRDDEQENKIVIG